MFGRINRRIMTSSVNELRVDFSYSGILALLCDDSSSLLSFELSNSHCSVLEKLLTTESLCNLIKPFASM